MTSPDARIRLTVGQAVVRFLVAQHTERDGTTQRAILGISGTSTPSTPTSRSTTRSGP